MSWRILKDRVSYDLKPTTFDNVKNALNEIVWITVRGRMAAHDYLERHIVEGIKSQIASAIREARHLTKESDNV